jgi:glycosyltransferase involved in cell wall biosynthesis/GR25 family glycosyltransferase involved in LPS biosynthesis
MQKLLIIAPHLSTGGMPQFLYKKIQILVKRYEVYVVEWFNITGGHLVVQRNLIHDLLGKKLYTLDENKKSVLELISKIQPDIIHFEEFPETFVDDDICRSIYSNKNYAITETTHGTGFNKDEKVFVSDKTMFVSECNYTAYESIANQSDLIKYPTIHKNREILLKDLGLDPSYYHVLNVGLFTPGKNQAEAFEMARMLQDKKVQFHFVGNQAGNFADYWEPLMKNRPDNCRVWGERNDTYRFYNAMDLFLFTSQLENRPLSVLEAISHGMDIMLYQLENYSREFADYEKTTFLTKSREENVRLLLEKAGCKETQPVAASINIKSDIRKISAFHMLTDIDTDREIRSMQSLTKLKDYGVSYQMMVNKRYTELPPAESCEYPEKISMEPGGKLTPGHYGCYLAHKKAFEEGIKTDSDFILIFECDAVIDIPYKDFMDKVELACNLLDTTDLFWFSFGYHNNTRIIEKNQDHWVVDGFYGAHAYLIPRKSFQAFKAMYENSKWNVADLLFVEKLNQYKAGIFETPITKQASGYSILDKIEIEHDRY